MNASKTRAVAANIGKYTSRSEFHTCFFDYVSGRVVPHSKANETNCPAGRILTETGRRLRPGINTGISSLLVSVYDEQSMLRGFINPADPVFANATSQSSQKRIELSDETVDFANEAALAVETEKRTTAEAALAVEAEKRTTAEAALAIETEKRTTAEAALAIETEKRTTAEAALAVETEKRTTAEAELSTLCAHVDSESIRRKKMETDIASQLASISSKVESEMNKRIKAETDCTEMEKRLHDEIAKRTQLESELAAIRIQPEKTVAEPKKTEDTIVSAAVLADRKTSSILVVNSIIKDYDPYLVKHGEVIDMYLDILSGKASCGVLNTKVKGSTATCNPNESENSIINIVHYSNFSIVSSAVDESKLVHFILTNYSAGNISVLFDTNSMSIGYDSKIEIPGKSDRTCIVSCISDGKRLHEYARSIPLPTPKSIKF